MNAPERKVSLAGLSLIGAGAVLGLALSVPAAPASADPGRQTRTETSATTEKDR